MDLKTNDFAIHKTDDAYKIKAKNNITVYDPSQQSKQYLLRKGDICIIKSEVVMILAYNNLYKISQKNHNGA